MNLNHVEISTNRLLLKPIALEYKEDVFYEFTEEITTYTYPRPAQNIEETESFINESIEGLKNGTNLIAVILEKNSHEFLGCAGLHNINKQPQLGIWLKKTAHGNKYGLEAITAIKEWAEQNLGCESFIYPVDQANIASIKIPETLGGEVIQNYDKVNHSGKILHILEYRIDRNKSW